MKQTKLPIVAIVGRANVGKSSLFNRLLNDRRAITDDKAGTTRDNVIGRATYDGKPCWLVDTAGLKTAEEPLEMNIQEQIAQATASATVIIMVVEAHIGIVKEDRTVAQRALKTRKPVLLVINKADKAHKVSHDFSRLGIKDQIFVSTIHGQGLDELAGWLGKNLLNVTWSMTDTIKVALVGRPNVGKSSLFNSLAGTDQAIVAPEAGTTRDINIVELEYQKQHFEIIDSAGIRRSGKAGRGVEYYSSLRTIDAIEETSVCVLLIDAVEMVTKLDLKIAGLVKDAGRGLIIALNKWDLVEKDANTFDNYAAQVQSELQFVAWAPLIALSAKDGKNVRKILELAKVIDGQRNRNFSTKELNTWLRSVVNSHPPAGLKNTFPKLKYMVQTGFSPPSFTFFGRYLKTLHWSYKRHLEKQLREHFELVGTAIYLNFREDDPKETRTAKPR